jgi:hypothetical protein
MMRIRTFARARDALDQLRLDHDQIRRLLREFDRLRMAGAGGPEGKAEIVDCLCDTLSLHAHLEEEIFYPLVRSVAGEGSPAIQAFCDHDRLLELIAQLDEMEPGDPDYDATVGDIADCVVPSMDSEQAVLFRMVRDAGIDTQALGVQMSRVRKAHQRDFTHIEPARQRA